MIPASRCEACTQDLPALPLLKPVPEPGDVDLCPHCTAPLAFVRGLRRRLATRRELDALPLADQHRLFAKQVIMLAQATFFRLLSEAKKAEGG